jgi:hypothetical protein
VVTVARDAGIRVAVTLDSLAPLALAIRSEMSSERVIVTALANHGRRHRAAGWRARWR